MPDLKGLEYRTVSFKAADIKSSDEGPGSFEGYGSVFDSLDSYKDTIAHGAFEKTIPDFMKDGFIAWGHDWKMPVATPTDVKEDDYGLWLEATFHSHPQAQQARTIAMERLARKKSMGQSIGFKTIQSKILDENDEVVPEDDIDPFDMFFGLPKGWKRQLTEIKLYEISLVMVPAESLAQTTVAKGGEPLNDHFTRVLCEVRGVVTRAEDLHELRVKEGRTLSAATRQRLQELADQISDAHSGLLGLLSDEAATAEEEVAKATKVAEARKLLAQGEQIFARIMR